MPMLIKTVATTIAADETGRPVDAVPVREWVEGDTDAFGMLVSPISVEESETGSPARIVAGKTATNSAGMLVDVTFVTGASPWFEAPEFADYAVVLDYENNRYALPALDESDDPILTRDGQGQYPKREVDFADAMHVTRYAIAAEDYPDTFTNALWHTYDGVEWSLIGGDGIGINVPRLERWLGAQAMYVEPTYRFNRMPYSVTATYPTEITLARAFSPGYRVSWVGNDDLVYSVAGHPDAPWSGTIAARSADASGLNWGVIPQVVAAGSETTFIDRANNPGTEFHSVNLDTWTDEYYPATSMIVTDAATDGGQTPPYAHTERSPEHVRVSSAVAALLGRGDSYPRAGTMVVETHQTMEPLAGNHRTIIGAHPDDGALYGRAFLGFSEASGVYSLTHESPFGGLSLALPSAELSRSRVRMALALNGDNNLRRMGISGVETVAEDTGNPGYAVTHHFGTATPSSYVATQFAAGTSGSGAYYKFMWSPDVFDAEKIAEEVAMT